MVRAKTVNLFIVFLLVGCIQKQDLQAAAAPAFKSSELPPIEIEQIRSGVWVHTSYQKLSNGIVYPSNGLLVREDEHLILIDPAWGAQATEDLLVRVKNEIGLPIKHAISTHFHGDRTLGVDVLAKAGIDVFAHPMTLELSASIGNPVPKIGLPEIESVGSSVTLGSVELFYPGPGHAHDNIVVWLAEEQLLYAGCAIREKATSTLGNIADADLSSWPIAIRRTQERYADALVIVPGHGEIGNAELFSHMFNLFDAVK